MYSKRLPLGSTWAAEEALDCSSHNTMTRRPYPHLPHILKTDDPNAVLLARHGQNETPLGAWHEDDKDAFTDVLVWEAVEDGRVRDDRDNHPWLEGDSEGRESEDQWVKALRFERVDTLAGLRLRVKTLERQLVEQGKRPVQTPTGRQLEIVAEELVNLASRRTMEELGTLADLIRKLGAGHEDDEDAGLRLRVETLERQLVEQGKRPVQTPTGRQLEIVAEELVAKGPPSRRTMVERGTLADLIRGFARWS